MDVTVFHNEVFALLVIQILPFVTSEHYFSSNDSTIWGKSNCTLAFPDLTYTDEDINVVNDNMSALSLPSEGAWIGLYKALLSFAYVGCNTLDDTDVLLVRILSDCRWQSGCDMFGVRKTDTDNVECKCFQSSVTNETGCTSICGSAEKYPCGSFGNSYFSIYTIENVSSCSFGCNIVTKGCLGVRFDRVNKVRWWLCNRPLNTSILCSKQPYNELDGRIEANGRSKTWVNTGQECFEKGLFPTLFRHIQSTNFNETGPFWTSVIRMDSLLRVDDNFGTSNPKQYAYVKGVNGELKVEFDGDLTKQGKTLYRGCGVTTTMQTTASKYTTTQASGDQTTHVYRTHTTATGGWTPYDVAIAGVLTSPLSSASSEKASRHIPIAGISAGVSIILLIVIAVVILICKRNRLCSLSEGRKSYTQRERGDGEHIYCNKTLTNNEVNLYQCLQHDQTSQEYMELSTVQKNLPTVSTAEY
ncbi:uncharacterized protein LOC128214585 [Mya arenaria]|uniref:uncharacterized protein LOC128214585 n=1 Tax=Mya arenaria TaxID=6604 RepID=UPI0022E97D41|nr:uncharacterized protein LOC128214585 [Mya arenaria]